jgi:hypothetical protein
MSGTLRLSALKLHVITANGALGRTLRFGEGLTLLRADNSSGKSTALQAIIYALGLEGMLGPSQRVPLPHAMTDTVVVNGRQSKVVQSWVELEIANAAGRIVSVRRAVVDSARDRRLITVFDGPAVTVSGGDFGSSDYFVRRQGSAQNEAGFHRFFSEFIGLKLPRVSKHDGSEVPLYLETLFPYFFVEQKHGWSSVQARIPSYLGIRDVGKRSAEFVLGLDVFARTLLRQRLRSNMSELEADWQTTSRQAAELASSSKLVIRNAPARISSEIEEDSFVPVASDIDGWKPIAETIEGLQAQLERSAGAVPTVAAAVPGVEADLQYFEGALRQALAVTAALAEEERESQAHLTQVDLRIDALKEDLQRHLDAQVLESYGSAQASKLMGEHICPTCHQELADGTDIAGHAMSASESIAFIRRQLATFENMRQDHDRVLRAIAIRRSSLASQVAQHRAEIRAARETLVSADSTPSVATISRRLSTEARVAELRERSAKLTEIRNELSAISRRWTEQRKILAEAEASDLSDQDQSKLRQVEGSLRTQLESYGFKSLGPDEIDIDRATFRPTHEGFDLGFDLSASDMIRLIWAYLFALLEVGSGSGNHLGLLVFDEPRQQDTARASFGALLSHAARAGAAGKQVLFATSEASESLVQMLGGAAYDLIDLEPGEKLLLPIE